MDIGKQLEHWMKNWGWPHLVTLVVTTLLLLIAFDAFVMPVLPVAEEICCEDTAFKMQRHRRDPRMFFDHNDIQTDDDHFVIAWISGSSINVHGVDYLLFDDQERYTLAEILATRLKTVNGKPVQVLNYFISGQRNIEFYLSYLHMTNVMKPDLVIVTVNPLYLYNDWSTYRKGNWMANLANWGEGTPVSKELSGRYLKPKDREYLLTKPFFQFSQRRYDGQQFCLHIHEKLGIYKKRKNKKKKKKKKKKHEATQVKKDWEYPVLWNWIEIKMPKEKRGHFDLWEKEYQHAAVQLNTPTPDNTGWKIHEDVLKTVANSDIPTLIYLAPSHPELLADPNSGPAVEMVRKAFKQQAQGLNKPTIRLRLDTIDTLSHELIYEDFIHVRDGRKVLDFVIQELDSLPGIEMEFNNIDHRFTFVKDTETLE